MFDKIKYKKPFGDISQPDIEKLTSFFFYLLRNKHKVKIIFRGENYDNLKSTFNLHGNNDYEKLSSFLFLLGEKGRIYRNEFKERISMKNKIYSLSCVSENLFKNIFQKLNYLFNKKNNNTEIQTFKTFNIELYEYFSNSDNKLKFIEKINSVDSVEKKIRIRDYYLCLLHKIGKIGFYNNSFYLSTTSEFNIAKRFSKNKDNSTRLIFFSWLTYPINKVGVNFNYLNKSTNMLKSLGLPVYSKTLYQSQKEISIKGGILPHYMLGFLNLENEEFIVNPNFFNTNKSFDEIIIDGIDIDQSSFNEKLNETDYDGFFTITKDGQLNDLN